MRRSREENRERDFGETWERDFISRAPTIPPATQARFFEINDAMISHINIVFHRIRVFFLFKASEDTSFIKRFNSPL